MALDNFEIFGAKAAEVAPTMSPKYFPLSWIAASVVVITVALGGVSPAGAQICSPGGFHGWTATTQTTTNGPNCLGLFRCYAPLLDPVIYVTTGGCDPTLSACTVRAQVRATFRGNHFNFGNLSNPVNLTWINSIGTVVGSCGQVGSALFDDVGDAWIQAGNFSCANPSAATGTGEFTLRVRVCPGATSCPMPVVSIPIALTPPAIADALCPPPPPPPPCKTCNGCLIGGGGDGSGGPGAPGKGSGGSGTGDGVQIRGGGAAVRLPGSPGATLRYLGRGIGHPGLPGSAAWNTTLGRYWSHDFAERIVLAPNAAHVWLLTRSGGFLEYTDTDPFDPDGLYEQTKPADEKDRLYKTAGGWELRFLDGQIQFFDNAGRWIRTQARTGQSSDATYDGSGRLMRVDFPDGQADVFTYYPAGEPSAGKLRTIEREGIDGVSRRVWTYTWQGLDLVRIDRPDARAIVLEYGNAALAGALTKMKLVGTDASERVLQGWTYDAEWNVVSTWRGAETPTDPTAVEVWELSFDDPEAPTETTVTDPLGETSIYQYELLDSRPRMLSISGSCPVCGSGPNTTFEYLDPLNPLLPTQETDGDGTVTVMSYDANGQMTSRIEAFGTALERETVFEHDTSFPDFVTEIAQPSVSGNPLDERRTSIVYDAEGNAISQTTSGLESGSPFSYTTTTAYNAVGQPTVIDPPGFGTADQTSFTYDPTRGDFVLLTRTDPLVGTTAFDYDVYNRRTSTIDPNGVETTSTYDALDRLTTTIQLGTTPAEDLLTQQVYNVFGDLWRIVRPRGNVIEYGYDTAGRLISIEAKPDVSTPGERTLYTLDKMGHRIQEQLQRWNGSAWVTSSSTGYAYSTRCHLDKILHPDGSVTEYDYTCDGQLEREWDANHPSAGQTVPATRVYAYDALERMSSVTELWGGAGGGTVATSYGYDVQDHLVAITDGEGNTTTYEYSDRDLMTQETSPVAGVTTYTYDDHGSQVSMTDARLVTVTRSYDAADRVTFVDYPDAALDTTHVYDDPGVPFSKGRLTAITRGSHTIAYGYDRFGRTTQDGALGYGYDPNGNRVTLTYPGGVVATYTFDFADREATLSVDDSVGVQTVVTAASYLPFGPLTALTLGNGVGETRLFTSRYFPDSIEVQAALSHLWNYATDAMGNVTEIEETECCLPSLIFADGFESGNTSAWSASVPLALLETGGFEPPVVVDRSFGYQDVQYFLTSASGPSWGTLAWSYDKIGNRLSEDRNGTLETYGYLSNGSGNTAILTQAGARSYTTGPAGHVTGINAAGNLINLAIDDEGRVAVFARPLTSAQTSMSYDGRSFLRRSEELLAGGPSVGFTEPTYSSGGLLHALRRHLAPAALEERVSVFHFAGRPVGQLRQVVNGASSWMFLSTDHLGTPALATGLAGEVVWHGPFEPFGEDSFRGSAQSALARGFFLRFPGQWEDETWEEATLGAVSYYNVHRWYHAATGRYSKVDPWGIEGSGPNVYLYGGANPLSNTDPDGRFIPRACKPDDVQWCQDQCKQRNLQFQGCKCFRVPLCFSLLDYALAACKEWQKGCSPCPPPPPPVIDYEHGHGPCKPGQGHFHYFEYHQSPPPQCICRLVRRFGGCL